MDEKFLKPYQPGETEGRVYESWEKSGYFNPDTLPSRHEKPFTVVMPPPNANGDLHAGHALFITLEDLFTRFRRMQGYKALWIPGADHAGFETQVVYEKKLEKEGRSRFGMDPKQLYEEIYAFTLENKKNMEAQVRAMGASCDWSREKFTLDPDVVKTVQETFVKMYQDGLIYRGSRTINWCYKHQTSLSDVETESVEEQTPFYYFKYGPFEIGTVRPETKFGDKYVVMHPEDTRYKEYEHGQKLTVEWINGPIEATVIKDAAVDREFGTGVMTITPWHSQVDFEIAKRHGLDMEQIIDWRGKLLPIAGEFAGMNIKDAREKIAGKLAAKGLLVKTDDAYKNVVKRCYKCNAMIEPQVMDQWFVKMAPLARKAIEAVNEGKVRFIPDNYEKIFRYWMENTLDWNISRQIVWGIPIPAWFCSSKERAVPSMGFHEEVVPQVSKGKTKTYRLRDQGCKVGDTVLFENSQTKEYFGYGVMTKVEKMQVKDIDYKDPAHFVTYESLEELIEAFEKRNPEKGPVTPERTAYLYEYEFHEFPLKPEHGGCGRTVASVAPPNVCPICGGKRFVQDTDTFDTWFSSGQWPLVVTGYPDSSPYYPTDVMETGHDLIFKWVPRMVIFGLYLSGQAPFHTVYLHGLVNDANGKKMSKSKGNVVNPRMLTEKYGTDALRMALVVGNTPGTDLALREDKVKGYKHFANKLWNIARFVLENAEGADRSAALTEADTALLTECRELAKEATNDLEQYRAYLAAEKLYHYVWHRCADQILEESKPILAGTDATAKASRKSLLLTLLETSLRLLHPFMPFVTEEIWSSLPSKDTDLLMVASWPK